jgi:putative membrane protein
MRKKLALFVFLLSILYPFFASADIGTVSLPNGTLSETPAFVKDKSSSISSSSSSDGLTLPNSGNTGASSSIVKPSPSENKDPLEKIADDTLRRSSDVVGANANQGVADSVKETQKKQEEEKRKKEEEEKANTKLSYANFKTKMKRLTSYVYFDKGLFGLGEVGNYWINKVVQAIFWFSKFLFGIIVSLVSAVEKMTDVSPFLNKVVEMASTVFFVLFGPTIKYIAGVFMAVYILFVWGKGGQVFKTALKLFLVFAVIGGFFTKISINGSPERYLPIHLYNVTDEITREFQTEIVKKVGTVDTSMAESYFNSTIIPAYKNMNSKKDSEGNYYLSEQDFQDLTNYQEGKGNFKLSDKEIKALTKKNDKNETEDVKGQNLVDEWSDKFTYAFTSIFDVVVVGVVYLSMGLGRVVILLSYAVLLLILPFALILSLFPQFNHYFSGISKKGISFLLISSAISLASVIVPIIYGNMSSYIEDFSGGSGLVATFLKCIVIWWLFKNRYNLLHFMNGRGNYFPSLTRRQLLGHLGNRMNLNQRAKTFATRVGDRVPNRVKSLARITKNNAKRWIHDKNKNRLEKRSSLAKMEVPQNDDYMARKIKRAKKVEWRKAHRREMLDRAKMKVEKFKNYGEKDKDKKTVNDENYKTLKNRVRENMYRKQEIKGYRPKARKFENGVWKETADLPSLKRLERKERIRKLQKKKGRLSLQERLAT